MSEQDPVDILFVVPDRFVDTYRRAIRLVIWSLELDKTFDVLSADSFVRIYGDMPVEEMDMALKKRCLTLVNSGDISKREWAAFEPVRQKLFDYFKQFEEGKKNERRPNQTQYGTVVDSLPSSATLAGGRESARDERA